MKNIEFQTESRLTTTNWGGNRLNDEIRITGSISPAAIESLLLGFLLRGRFTEAEKEQLDRMAPSRSITFVIQSGKWLHPENLSLFDLNVLSPSADQQNGAIFTHFCQPVPGSSLQRHKITTAIINPGSKTPLTLGLLGPDHEISPPYRENRFVSLVDLFRKAYRPAADLARRLDSKIKPNEAAIIVNRASGKVIHATSEAAKICNRTIDSLLDREYHQIKESFPHLRPGMRFQLENLNESDLSIGILKIGVPTDQTSRVEKEGLFLIDQSESALHLLRSSSASDSRHCVIRPTGKISHCLTRLKHGLIGHEDLNGKSNLLVAMDNAIRNMIGGHESQYPIQIKTYGSNFTLQTANVETVTLLETALLVHLDRNQRPFQTEIRIDSGVSLTLTMTTATSQNSQPLEFQPKWIKQLDNFNHVCDISHRRSDGETRLETIISFKESPKL